MEQIFSMFDKKNNKTIQLDDIRVMLGLAEKLEQEALAKLLADIGNSGQNEITFEEFKKLLNKILD